MEDAVVQDAQEEVEGEGVVPGLVGGAGGRHTFFSRAVHAFPGGCFFSSSQDQI